MSKPLLTKEITLMSNVWYKYIFKIQDGTVLTKIITVDTDHMLTSPPEGYTPSPWTHLENGQCDNCPLDPKETKYCPVAANLDYLASEFSVYDSYQDLEIRVETPVRVYEHQTTMQQGLKSIFGLSMATSGCPHMNFLKPMARYHLPFSSVEETAIRVFSFFLLSEYFNHGFREDDAIMMEHLIESYNNVTIVNKGVAQRIRSVDDGDARINSIVCLDTFAQSLKMQISKEMEVLEEIFKMHSDCVKTG